MSEINRRNFLLMGGISLASMGVSSMTAQLPSKFPVWEKGLFQVHFIYTGVAESLFLIFPDGTSMLLDCGDCPAIMRHPYDLPVPYPRKMAGEVVADYVLRVNPNGLNVDYMMVSHFHSDHVGTPNWQSCGTLMMKSRDYVRSGFGIASEKLKFARAIDRGWPNYDDPVPYTEGYDRELEHVKKLYAHLMRRDGLSVTKFEVGVLNQVKPLHESVADFSVFNICGNGKVCSPDGRMIDVTSDLVGPRGFVNENGMSLGLLFSYGPFRFLTAGDFSCGCDHANRKAGVEGRLAEVCGRVHVAKVNHHGHHSMPRELVAAQRAQCYVACVWDRLHMTEDTCSALQDSKSAPPGRKVYPSSLPQGVFDSEHYILTVYPGGHSYSITTVDASDEAMRIKACDNFDVA